MSAFAPNRGDAATVTTRATADRTAPFLAAAAGLQALGGAALWCYVLARFSVADRATVGTVITTSQLAGLLGAAGVPIVVARHHSIHRDLVVRIAPLVAVGGATAAGLITLLSRATPWRGVGQVTFVLLAGAAAVAPAADAAMAATGRWSHLLQRIGLSSGLRVSLLASLPRSPTALAIAILLPDAITSVAAIATSRSPRCGPAHGAGIARYGAVQYASTLLWLGPVLLTPVVWSGRLTLAERSAFYPAWAIVTMTATVAGAAASAPLFRAGGRNGSPIVALAVPAVATAAAWVASAIPLGPGLHAVAADAAPLLSASLLWPWVAHSLACLRRERRGSATLILTATWFIGSVWLLAAAPFGPSTTGLAGAMGAAAATASAIAWFLRRTR